MSQNYPEGFPVLSSYEKLSIQNSNHFLFGKVEGEAYVHKLLDALGSIVFFVLGKVIFTNDNSFGIFLQYGKVVKNIYRWQVKTTLLSSSLPSLLSNSDGRNPK